MVILLSDSRKINDRFFIKTLPIPKIQEIMIKIEGFTHVSSLDLNMRY